MIFNKPKNYSDFGITKNSTFQFHLFRQKSKIRRICKAISYVLQIFFSQASVYKGCGVKLFSNPTSFLLKSERILALLILRKRQRSVNVKNLQQ